MEMLMGACNRATYIMTHRRCNELIRPQSLSSPMSRWQVSATVGFLSAILTPGFWETRFQPSRSEVPFWGLCHGLNTRWHGYSSDIQMNFCAVGWLSSRMTNWLQQYAYITDIAWCGLRVPPVFGRSFSRMAVHPWTATAVTDLPSPALRYRPSTVGPVLRRSDPWPPVGGAWPAALDYRPRPGLHIRVAGGWDTSSYPKP